MLIDEIKKEYHEKGLRKKKRESFLWYKNSRDDTNIDSIIRLPKQKGFNEFGKINIYSYNPLHKDTLSYFDRKPVVLSLGTIKHDSNRVYDFGINLNFIPFPHKFYILNTIRRMYNGFHMTEINRETNAIKQRKILYKYNAIKTILRKYNVEFAFRMYIPSRKSRLYTASYQSWKDLAFLSIENFEGVTYKEFIKLYNKSKQK